MVKSYRRRFVIFNMAIIAAVLLVSLTVTGIFMFRREYDDLEATLSAVVRPWNEPTDRFSDVGERPSPPEGGEHVPPGGEWHDRGAEPDERMARREGHLLNDSNIVTAFCRSDGSGVSILSDTASDTDGEQICSAVNEIIALEDDYGVIDGYGLIYYKEPAAGGYKLALTDVSYLEGKMWTVALQLAALFAALIAFFFVVSLYLSKRAAKPMEDAVEMERQFVADISHDLKTPITVILANNSIIKSSPETTVAEQSQWIDSTDGAAKNMMELVNEMLTLSSLESGGRTAAREYVDLSDAAEKAVLQMESVAYDRGVEVVSEIAPALGAVADPAFVDRIFNGLLENALKYEPDGGKVEVGLTNDKKTAVFTVKNSGSFIAQEDLPHIFERFYRGDKARSEKSGHGLGLPIIKQMADLINARITVESGRERGTSFTVAFQLNK